MLQQFGPLWWFHPRLMFKDELLLVSTSSLCHNDTFLKQAFDDSHHLSLLPPIANTGTRTATVGPMTDVRPLQLKTPTTVVAAA
jgi:hypothetical protein